MTLASQSPSQPRPAICFVYYGHFRFVVVVAAAAVSVIIVSCLCLVFCLRFRFTHTFCFVRHFLVLVVVSSRLALSLPLTLSMCVCVRVFAFVFFHPIFVVYFYLHLLLLLILLFVVVVVSLRALLWATNSWNSFLHFFLVAAHTFPAGKTSFSRRRLRMHSSSCLFTVRNAGASWIRRKEQRKQTTRSALSHFDLSLSLICGFNLCGWHCEGGVWVYARGRGGTMLLFVVVSQEKLDKRATTTITIIKH